MLGIQIIVSVFALFALARVFDQFRKKKLGALWMFGWLIFWALVIIAVFLPQTTQTLADVLGVGRGVDVVIYLALVSLFFLVFKLFVKLESLEQEISQLVRKISIDEHDK
jgi:hypothetical protein